MILNAQPARFNFVFFAKMSGATTPHSDFSVDKKMQNLLTGCSGGHFLTTADFPLQHCYLGESWRCPSSITGY
jgi:hypothetical protein